MTIDGKAFHTFTKGLKKPYDKIFHDTMNQTTRYLCENIQGCKLGYTQSDEITLLLTDYDTLTTDAWFDNNVQKICSISASMATMAFNKFFRYHVNEYIDATITLQDGDLEEGYLEILGEKIGIALFDSRCFNIPVEEVTNCFIWRQEDATRNAIQMLGQAYFSHKELNNKSCNDIQDMLMLNKNINFNNMPVEFKRGVCCIKKIIQDERVDIKEGAYPVKKWVLDKNIPIFKKNREYIENLLIQKINEVGEEKNE